MTTKFPPIKTPARRGIDPEEARALAESEGLGIQTTPDGVSQPVPEGNQIEVTQPGACRRGEADARAWAGILPGRSSRKVAGRTAHPGNQGENLGESAGAPRAA